MSLCCLQDMFGLSIMGPRALWNPAPHLRGAASPSKHPAHNASTLACSFWLRCCCLLFVLTSSHPSHLGLALFPLESFPRSLPGLFALTPPPCPSALPLLSVCPLLWISLPLTVTAEFLTQESWVPVYHAHYSVPSRGYHSIGTH